MCNVEFKLGEVVKSWLEDRVQFVQVGERLSGEKPVVNGSVVQGSRLGPVLWLIYVNGLLNKLQEIGQKFTAFADDVIIYGPVNSSHCEKKLQKSLDVIQKWSNKNNMKFSDAKSSYMKIGTQRHARPMINNNQIPKVTEMVILGVTFSEEGKFTRMAKLMADRTVFKTQVIRNNLLHRDVKSLKMIYNAYIKSRLFYCSQVWHQKNSGAESKIRKAIKKYRQLHQEGRPPDVMTTSEQLFYNDVVQINRIQSGNTIIRGYSLGMSGNDDRIPAKLPTRAATRFQLRNEFRHRLRTLWNWLPTWLRTCESMPAFSKELRGLIERVRESTDTCSRIPVLT